MATSFNFVSNDKLDEAIEYFGAEAAEDRAAKIDSLKVSGIDIAQYNKVFEAPVEEDKEEVELTTNLDGVEVTIEDVEEREVGYAKPEVLDTRKDWLIKMERQNNSFQHKGYKFTQEYPYQLVPADVAEDLLKNETGFRQAYPSEIASVYDLG